MEKTPLSKLVDGLGAGLNEVLLGEEGNSLWELPACMEDELSSDNSLGDAIRGLARAITKSNA